MNPREFEILSLLSAKEAANLVPESVKRVQSIADDSAPAMTDFMAVAAGTASGDVIAAVTAYCDAHPEYVEMLEHIKLFARDQEMPEPAIKGSILERMKISDFDRRGMERIDTETAEDESLPIREAARV